MSDTQRTELSELGEFGLIQRLGKPFATQNPSTIKGIGDDAAVIDFGEQVGLVSTDYLVEGIHFDLAYTPLKHLGFKAVAVNVSDIAAMNGVPTQITVSLALSNRFSVEALEELYEGIKIACEAYKVDLVGGDTTSSLSGLVISVTALGMAKKEDVVYRSNAKVGDVVCVTGDLGGAYLGLQILEREKQVFMGDQEMQPELEGFDYVIQRLLKPEARMDIVHMFKEMKFKPNSMIDISDGLASELIHIGSQSGVGFEIWDENLPIDNVTYEKAIELNLGPEACALNGGEDYELLFTCSPKEIEKLKNFADIHTIGEVKEKEYGFKFVTKQGNVYDLTAQGWNHFKNN